MAACTLTGGEAFRRNVLILAGNEAQQCMAVLDPGSWTPETMPLQISGFLELPRSERAVLANSERLTLKFRENGEPYRLLLDGDNGRFLARKM